VITVADVAIFDMQPICPATGGGRLRLLGLYHELGEAITARYLGTYDWPGNQAKRQLVSPQLEENLVTLSDAHFAAVQETSKMAGNRPVIDCTFAEFAHLSPAFLAAAREAAARADIVVFSHPWIFPLLEGQLDPLRQLIVYDAHNVEGLLRTEILDDGGEGTRIARTVVATEFKLCHTAHLVLTCSTADGSAFSRLYGISSEKIRVLPNGAFTDAIVPSTAGEKASLRAGLGLDNRRLAVFAGSNYGPNVTAAAYIAEVLAPASRHVQFAVLGGVCASFERRYPENVRLVGPVSQGVINDWLRAADVAINPMFSGSGTNVKMFDYMAAGLPIVTTPVGARGVVCSEKAFCTAEPRMFGSAIDTLMANPPVALELGRSARRQAERLYSWRRISRHLGRVLKRNTDRLCAPAPFFSVVIPTYDRHALLDRLMQRLAAQTWRDFEVIVVDQSEAEWTGVTRPLNFDLCYVHSDVQGAVLARNMGADLARGHVIAFTDDDCEPVSTWLAAAQREFYGSDIVGLEGLVASDGIDDAARRPVRNDGLEGLAFMTSNLFVRADIFRALGGFDLQFDQPHFREDTDLGWRAQQLGKIPFSRAARVFHPSHPRNSVRESLLERSRYFEKDALLLRKHPERYLELALRERQWTQNPYFWAFFEKGVQKYEVQVPPELKALMSQSCAKCDTAAIGTKDTLSSSPSAWSEERLN